MTETTTTTTLPPLTRGQATDIAQRMELLDETEADLRSIDIYVSRETPVEALRSIMTQLLYEDDAAFTTVAAEVISGIRARKVEKAQALAAELGFAWKPRPIGAEDYEDEIEIEDDEDNDYGAGVPGCEPAEENEAEAERSVAA